MPPSPGRQEPAPGSRQRLVSGASRLLMRQGYAASGLKQIAAEGSAPMGSVYFHFPGGKEELAVEALRHGARGFAAFLDETLSSTDRVEEALARCALRLADDLRASDWLDGCPVATTALESVSRSEPLRSAAAEAFLGWQDVIADHLRRDGLPDEAARALASTALALLEGAELLARVQASAVPLERAAGALRVFVRAGRTAAT